MSSADHAESQYPAGLSLRNGLRVSGLSPGELWTRYLAVGGNAGSIEVEAYACGLLRPGCQEHNFIAQALNDYFADRGSGCLVAYQPGS